MKRRVLLTYLTAGLLSLAGCYYDVEEELYPNNCDATNPTYTQTVKPILDNNCANACHYSGSTLGAGIVLDNYNDVLVYVNSGQLIGAITHQAGFFKMPKNGAKLDDCSIQKIENWVQAGMPQ